MNQFRPISLLGVEGKILSVITSRLTKHLILAMEVILRAAEARANPADLGGEVTGSVLHHPRVSVGLTPMTLTSDVVGQLTTAKCHSFGYHRHNVHFFTIKTCMTR
ncbi:hypothetical protein PoB_001431200 [Plakobranchus ocellatus]|uniref:Uncharacterized protein n=1 Tax=Plakobranchus ocellatus TaxID=259542 RepID=A0AAV3YZT8_9GAST|nr:hypothetical protein PoB_001431200 [Plakobranchus ocellatus]